MNGGVLGRVLQPFCALLKGLADPRRREVGCDGWLGAGRQFVVVAIFWDVGVRIARDPELPATLVVTFPGTPQAVIDVLSRKHGVPDFA